MPLHFSGRANRKGVTTFRIFLIVFGILCWIDPSTNQNPIGMMVSGMCHRLLVSGFSSGRIPRIRPSTSVTSHTVRFSSRRTESDDGSLGGHVVNWYPGHIGKAERQLQDMINLVDVVLEIRDARLPTITRHPMTATWSAGTPRILVVTHSDVIPKAAARQWKNALTIDQDITDKQIINQAKQVKENIAKYTNITNTDWVIRVNAQSGHGVRNLIKVIQKAGSYIQKRRQARGLLPRPLRVGVLGYPNTGKSSLINRILNRKRAKAANTPGVTKNFQWIRVRTDKLETKHKEFELLDAPGIIPASLDNQTDAMLLAACNCVGEGAYDNQIVAAFLCQTLLDFNNGSRDIRNATAPEWRNQCVKKYKLDPKNFDDGDHMLYTVANNVCNGVIEDAARKVLQDVRSGRMGPICLELVPKEETALSVDVLEDRLSAKELEDLKRAGQQALRHIQEKGLELPQTTVENVGKGQFEGW